MTDDWREELIEQMADAMFACDEGGTLRVDVMARAALSVAEPAIRERCARIADAIAKDYRVYRDHFPHAEGAEQVAAAIREGGIYES